MKENYIKAALELINSGSSPENVIEGLKNTLKNNGHSQLLASVCCVV